MKTPFKLYLAVDICIISLKPNFQRPEGSAFVMKNKANEVQQQLGC